MDVASTRVGSPVLLGGPERLECTDLVQVAQARIADDLVAHAGRLAEHADALSAIRDRLAGRIAASRWRSPAASACLEEARDCLAQLSRLGELYGVAAVLARAAAPRLSPRQPPLQSPLLSPGR